MINIKYGNVWCYISPQDQKLIKDSCRFKKEIFKRGMYGMEKVSYENSMIKNNRFLSGLINRVNQYCENKNIDILYKEHFTTLNKIEPSLKHIIFRDDQKKAISQAVTKGRGIIKAPTGSGKTVIAGGICSTTPHARILFLCHTLDLLTQTYEEFNSFGLSNVKMLGGGNKIYTDEIDDPCIIVSTIQTLHKLNPSIFKSFDMVIIDECHHVTDGSSYTKFLESVDIPIRIGLTATPPQDHFKKLTVEGYLGDIIAELTIEEGMEMGIIAKPFIDLIAVPYISRIGELKSYREIYQKAVIENKTRNHLILEYALDAINKKQSVLILTGKEIEHGTILKQMAKEAFGKDIPFLYGLTSKEDRTYHKNLLKNKELQCAIANIIWYEGINIPPIDIIINAEGGKASGKTLQKVGRGLRTSEGKDKLIIVDFLDPYKYLSHHCVLRLSTYAEQGWLKPNY